MGATWVYEVTYEDEVTEWTVEVTGEETYAGVDTYTTVTSFSAPPARKAMPTLTAVTISGANQWVSKTTLDAVHFDASTTMFGLQMTAMIDLTYTGDHGWPLSEGMTWSYVRDVVLDPPAPRFVPGRKACLGHVAESHLRRGPFVRRVLADA